MTDTESGDAPHQQLARDIYKELIEVNTTHAAGGTTAAAEAMAARFRSAGFQAGEILGSKLARSVK